MLKARPHAIAVGALFWVALAASALFAMRRPDDDAVAAAVPSNKPSMSLQVFNFLTVRSRTLSLSLPRVPARQGDPIFTHDPAGSWIQAGYLTYTDNRHSATTATATWYAGVVDPENCHFSYHYTRGRLSDIVQLLLPPEKRQRIRQMIREGIALNGDEIADAIRPVITRSLRQSVPVIERALKESIATHRDEIEELGERYREAILQERLLPLVREEVMPIVRQHAEPVVQKIGRELWDSASLWRFGWRAVYDRTPLPDRDLLKREWDRFVEREAIPIFERHMDELIEAQRNIMIDISKNPRIHQELQEVAQEIAGDPQLQDLVTSIVRESIIDNRELRAVWAENWQSEDAKAAIKLTGERLEPIARKIGDELFGTREGGISPSFARVLRNQILGKDRRWIVADPMAAPVHSGGTISVERGRPGEPFPVLILASPVDDV